MNRRIFYGCLAVLAVVGAGWLFATHRDELLSLAEWARSETAWSAPFFLAGFTLAILLALPTWPLMVAGGYVYGAVFGWAMVSIACLAGATVAFLLGRGVARDWVAGQVGDHPRFRAVDRAIATRGFAVVLLLRLSVVIPYNILNYALGVTAVPTRKYVAASWLGMQPVLLFYVLLGAGASDLATLVAGGPTESVNPWLVASAVAMGLGVLWLITRTAGRMLAEDLAETD